MIRLTLPDEPYWIDLGDGVAVRVRPCDTRAYQTARSASRMAASEALAAIETVESHGGSIADLDLTDRAEIEGLSQQVFVQALARAAIVDWRGVVDDEDRPLALTPERAAELMRFHDIAERFLDEYGMPYERRFSEGNASGPSAAGISAEGPTTAPDAAKPDRPAPADGAGETDGDAPTGPASRDRKKAH
ncbi:hypothetical protein [Minwuia thermotolerans]|uniref:Uncharacterized protein n=1 Tax=Minwuia thermotolerans TaxID=2056226 RepID=A0A2M9G2M7_9PROT|nr:hypothetical protein [Minwuia thermotolerans]PJK29955.1 hypothetical protein CVT23_09310 [Minwuia thermotolerans]